MNSFNLLSSEDNEVNFIGVDKLMIYKMMDIEDHPGL